MKILVSVKRVPHYEIKVKVQPDGKGIQTDGIKWSVNPFDEIAVEEALRIKEKRGADAVEVVVTTIGPESAAEQLLATLAMGADRAIHIVNNEPGDSSLAARAIAALGRRDSYDLIILGKQAIDSDANQTGQLVAAELDLPQATFASKVVLDDTAATAEVTREVDGGLERLRLTLPAVITTDLRLNEPRYASLPGIVKAKKKPMEKITLADLGVTTELRERVKKFTAPTPRKGGGKVASVSELVEKLKNEAKVL